jgi:sodium-dependent dicarboxylate transporter 2/3/5
VSNDAPEPTSPPADARDQSRTIFSFVGAAVLAVAASWSLLQMGGVPREAAFMSGIFVLAAALWVTEALPLFATSLLVIALQIVFLANPG